MHVQQEMITSHPQAIAHPIRTLLLDDSNFDRARIRRLSGKTDLPIELDEVDSIADMERAIRAAAYDLILIDYRLPVGDGLTALEAIQHTPLNRGAGTIMITGNAEVDTAVSAMRSGCHDFLSKDAITVEMLRNAMTNAIQAAARHRRDALAETLVKVQVRDTVAEALKDPAMREILVEALSGHLLAADRIGNHRWSNSQSGVTDDFILGVLGEDEFIFN